MPWPGGPSSPGLPVTSPPVGASRGPVRAKGSPIRDSVMIPAAPVDWRWRARRALTRLGPRVIPALVEALSAGEDATIRSFAAESLARLGREARSASEALRHAASSDPDPSVREA